jgi:hypothetical protein
MVVMHWPKKYLEDHLQTFQWQYQSNYAAKYICRKAIKNKNVATDSNVDK